MMTYLYQLLYDEKFGGIYFDCMCVADSSSIHLDVRELDHSSLQVLGFQHSLVVALPLRLVIHD